MITTTLTLRKDDLIAQLDTKRAAILQAYNAAICVWLGRAEQDPTVVVAEYHGDVAIALREGRIKYSRREGKLVPADIDGDTHAVPDFPTLYEQAYARCRAGCLRARCAASVAPFEQALEELALVATDTVTVPQGHYSALLAKVPESVDLI